MPAEKAAKTEFGRAIQQRLNDLHMPQREIEGLLQVSKSTLYRMLNGDAAIDAQQFYLLAMVLMMDAHQLYQAYLKSRVPDDSRDWRVDEFGHFRQGDRYIDNDLSVASTMRLGGMSPTLRGLYWRVAEGPPGIDAANARLWAFHDEALRRGADERELAFIRSVLQSPEAIFRQSGYSGTRLAPMDQHAEVDAIIEMLRFWLAEHQRRRGFESAPEAAAGG